MISAAEKEGGGRRRTYPTDHSRKEMLPSILELHVKRSNLVLQQQQHLNEISQTEQPDARRGKRRKRAPARLLTLVLM
jgi:hypothetical protein